MKRKNKIITYSLFLFLLVCTFSFTNKNNNDNNKVYAINKPTYSDMIKDKYGEDISDEKAKSIAKEESTMKEAYAKGLGEAIVTTEKVTNKYASYYGSYPNGYTGAVNYRRDNFLLTAYSLRDISKADEMQPLKTGVVNLSNYTYQGFNTNNWNTYGMTSVNTIKWLINQYEPKKLLRVYKDIDYLILSAVYSGDYKAIIDEKDTLSEVVSLIGLNGLESLEKGDLLLNYNEDEEKVNYVGVFLGKDENGNYYSLSPNKLIVTSDGYLENVYALSYVNSSNVYPQTIKGNLNLVSGSNYNYGIKLKFLK